jgi:hypothetical protein
MIAMLCVQDYNEMYSSLDRSELIRLLHKCSGVKLIPRSKSFMPFV